MLAAIAALAVGLAACSGSDSGPSQAELDAAEAARAAAEAEAAAAKQAAEEAAAAAARAAEEARQQVIAEQEKQAVMDAVAAAMASVGGLMDDSSDADVAGAAADIAAATAAIAAASTLSEADMAMYNAQVAEIQANLTLAQANIRAYRAEMAAEEANQQATAAERAKMAVDDATTALNAATEAQGMSQSAYEAAVAVQAAAQSAVANADSETLADASAALAEALIASAAASADLAVKTQAVADATTALEMAAATLAEVDPDHVALQAANAALAKAETDAQAQAAKIKALEDEVARLKQAEEDRQQAARDEAEKERMMQMAADGKALHAAIGMNPLTQLAATTADTINAAGALDLAAGAATGAIDPPAMMAGDPAGTLGGWKGTHYANTDTGTKVTNAAVVYSNQDDPDMEPFGDIHSTGYTAATHTLTLTANADDNIMGSGFPTVGTKTFSANVTGGSEVSVTGEYDGVAGTYFCTIVSGTPCTAAYGSDGITLGTNWSFVHGAGAMVPVTDDDYLYFGWWLRSNEDGPTTASAFVGAEGTPPTALTGVNAIAGSATYVGKAAGKYAIYNPLDATGDAGHFTADATLTAKFSGDGAGVTGTINNFMAGDKSMPWSVALNNNTLASDADGADAATNLSADGAGTITSAPDYTTATPDVDDSKTTVWSIDGNSAAASGTWSGQMYDEAQTGAADDGSDVPTTVLGTFNSEFGSIGRMVGAFGAGR